MTLKEGELSQDEAAQLREVSAEAMAAALAFQIPATFRRLVEAGADRAALQFYKAVMNLNATHQLGYDHPLNNPAVTAPTPEETVDL